MALRSTGVKKQPTPPKPGEALGLGLGGKTTSTGNPVRPKLVSSAPAPIQQPTSFGLGAAPAPAPATPISTTSQSTTTKSKEAPTDPATDPSSPYYQGYDDSAADLAADIASTDSLLMQNAAYEGEQTASDRGMLNSSMAAEAAQTAVLDVAVPLAQQEAQQAFEKNMSGLGLEQQMEMAQFDRQTQVMLQEFEQRNNLEMAEYEADVQMALLQAEQLGELESTLQLMEAEQTFVAEQAAFDRELESQLAELNLTADEQQGAETAMLNAFNDYNAAVASINANPNISSEERAAMIQAEQEMLEMRIEYTNELYSTAFDWPENPWQA